MSTFNFEPRLQMHHRLEIHAIKAHGANNMNRDDVGRPKELYLGGVRRQRLSSQSQKAAIRKGEGMLSFLLKLGKKYPVHCMKRTTRAAELMAEVLLHQSKNNKEGDRWTDEIRNAIATEVAKHIAKFDGGSAKTQLVATSKAELEKLLETLRKAKPPNQFKDAKEAKDWVESAFKEAGKELESRMVRGDFTPEVALFGRMTTGNDLFARVDSPLQVMHAYTTHEVPVQKDYWTATDDIHKNFDEMLVKPTDKKAIDKAQSRHAGSSMIDVRRFSSGVFYHYYCIDLDLLSSNLVDSAYSPEQVTEIGAEMVGYFLLAVIGEQPTGHKTGLASPEIAELVGAGIGAGFPLCATAAFEEPVKKGENGGFLDSSIDKLRDWYKKSSDANKGLMTKLEWSGKEDRGHVDLVRSLANQSYKVLQQAVEARDAASATD